VEEFHSTQTKQQNIFFPKFDKNLGCYRLPPLKEISSLKFGEASKKEGYGLPRWLPPLKGTFVGSLGPWVQPDTPWFDLALGHLVNP
jgi:hypothetical protein